LTQALGATEEPVALGPTVPTREAHRSLEWARLALNLVERGLLRAEGPVVVERHLSELILLRDEELARALVKRRLGPLESLAAGERDRLLETLRAWLEHQRQTPAIAAQLHVHPQTVRYRMGKLRELLGASLEDPGARFELELALRCRAATHR
jgi:DNA-binding PucR family transcriptional regulator